MGRPDTERGCAQPIRNLLVRGIAAIVILGGTPARSVLASPLGHVDFRASLGNRPIA